MRIDVVHYCEREAILAEKRRRHSFFDRNHDGEDPTAVRLRLLCRTLRNEPNRLGVLVEFLKLPYMTRETCKSDIARAVAVLPNLLYVDLPEGVFIDDASCLALRAEVQARCPNLKKMGYLRGSERSLAEIARGNTWPNLEVLELTEIHLDVASLRRVFGALPYLHTLKVSNMKMFGDDIFQDNPMIPPFPALRELHLEETHNITGEGLASYIAQTDTFSRLEHLSLTATGVLPSSIHLILAEAKKLRFLSIIESVTQSMPADPNMRPLTSDSLETLHWEISSGTSGNSFSKVDLMMTPYYDYLRTSLLSQSLPNLTELYVRDPSFPETLLDLTPPRPIFAAADSSTSNSDKNRNSNNPFLPGHRQTQSFNSRNPFNTPTPPTSPPFQPQGISQSLTIYSKDIDEMEWNFSKLQPANHNQPGNRGSITAARPVSSYGLLGAAGGDNLGSLGTLGSLATFRGNDARKSVLVGNGFGGFLAVPEAEVRPSSSYGEKGMNKEKRSTRIDMWR